MASEPYWFAAKRYGWGWGWPRTWQGWAVLVAFFALLAAGFFIFPPEQEQPAFLAYSAVLTVAVIAICYVKGEPPRWRWGK